MAQASGMVAAAGTLDGAALLNEQLAKPLNHVGFASNGVFQVDSLEGLQRLARVYIAGGYCEALVRGASGPEQAVARVMIALSFGRQIGLSDIQALNCIAVINGKPSLYGDGPIALVLARGHLENIEETFEGDGASMVAVCRVKRKGLAVHERRFGAKDKERAGINNPNYNKYPARMYQLRARAFALRDRFADDLMGIAIKEELEDQIEGDQSAATSSLVERIDAAARSTGETTPPVQVADHMTGDESKFVESLGEVVGPKQDETPKETPTPKEPADGFGAEMGSLMDTTPLPGKDEAKRTYRRTPR